jgi:sugar lactone lactonase YvrE
MRLLLLAILSLALAAPAWAVQPQLWKTATVDEFLTGELEGMLVTSGGELRPGPAVEKIASFTDPFVLSQVADGTGTRYFGTGNDGKVYRLRGKELKLLYTAPEPEIYALAFSGGALYVGSSPSGKIYRVDPASGAGTEFYDPKEAYIWAIEPLREGGFAVATGVEGKLHKVTAAGKGSVLFDAPEYHLRAIATAAGGKLLVGGSGEGRIYEVGPTGSGRALYDSALTEISSIWFDAKSGRAWASGVGNVLPTAAPVKSTKTEAQKTAAAGATDATKEQESGEAATADVEVSFSFDSGPAMTSTSGSELYRIEPDGFVEIARKFEREAIYALGGDGNGGVYVSTGPNGRVYRFDDNEIALIAAVPEKQVVSFANDGDAMIVTTTNSGAVYRLGGGAAGKGEYRSSVKDTARFSRFGSYEIDGLGIDRDALAISFRSGNSNTPDATWSEWSSARGARGAVAAPAARYLQWKIDASRPVTVRSVAVAFLNRNVAPVIDNLSVLEPGAVIVSTQYPGSTQVLEATNPDENGIFASLDVPRERNDPGKRMFRRGYRTLTWKAHDDNGDTLRYALSFRKRGTENWLPMREDIDESQFNFDTSQLPDGVYEVRLVASDERDNPVAASSDAKSGVEFTVDNTAPRIAFETAGGAITVKITDALSPIAKAEYSVDAEKWHRMLPVDGIADSPEETFRLEQMVSEKQFVVIRAVDAHYNVATGSVDRR